MLGPTRGKARVSVVCVRQGSLHLLGLGIVASVAKGHSPMRVVEDALPVKLGHTLVLALRSVWHVQPGLMCP